VSTPFRPYQGQDLLMGRPQLWGSTLPDPDAVDADGNALYPTLDDYLGAIQGAYDAQPGAAGAYSADYDLPNGMHAAGSSQGLTKGAEAAGNFGRILERANQEGVKGPGLGLMIDSRMQVRPEEAALAYNYFEVDPTTGEPVMMMDPSIYNWMEAYGATPTPLPEVPGTPTPAPGATPPLTLQELDANQQHALDVMTTNQQQLQAAQATGNPTFIAQAQYNYQQSILDYQQAQADYRAAVMGPGQAAQPPPAAGY